jgi:hypothetical protein
MWRSTKIRSTGHGTYVHTHTCMVQKAFLLAAIIITSTPGTDDMIFKILLPKNLAKTLAFFTQATATFLKN